MRLLSQSTKTLTQINCKGIAELKTLQYLCTNNLKQLILFFMKAIDMDFSGLVYTTYAKAKKEVGVSYLGGVSHSTKLLHSKTALNIATYGVYLAPSNISGYNVCQNSDSCREHCLFGSGHTMIDILSGRMGAVEARIKKTRLWKQNPTYFMKFLISEIRREEKKAKRKGFEFSVRLNCTSDINISEMNYEGVNICNIFPNVQFYDYSKIYSHLDNVKKFANYDITFSFTGSNWKICELALKKGVRIGVVFEKNLPKKFHGYEVVNGDSYDARYYDADNVVVGLRYKMTASAIKDSKFTMPKTPFIVQPINVYCEW